MAIREIFFRSHGEAKPGSQTEKQEALPATTTVERGGISQAGVDLAVPDATQNLINQQEVFTQLIKAAAQPMGVVHEFNSTPMPTAKALADLIPAFNRVNFIRTQINNVTEALVANDDDVARGRLSYLRSSLERELISTLVEQGGLDDSERKTEILDLVKKYFRASVEEINDWHKYLNPKQIANFKLVIGLFVKEQPQEAINIIAEYIAEHKGLRSSEISDLLTTELSLLVDNCNLEDSETRAKIFTVFVNLLERTEGASLIPLEDSKRTNVLKHLKNYPEQYLDALTSARLQKRNGEFTGLTLLDSKPETMTFEIFTLINDLIDKHKAFENPELKKRILDLTLKYGISGFIIPVCSNETPWPVIGIRLQTPYKVVDVRTETLKALVNERIEDFIQAIIRPKQMLRINYFSIIESPLIFPDQSLVQQVLGKVIKPTV